MVAINLIHPPREVVGILAEYLRSGTIRLYDARELFLRVELSSYDSGETLILKGTLKSWRISKPIAQFVNVRLAGRSAPALFKLDIEPEHGDAVDVTRCKLPVS